MAAADGKVCVEGGGTGGEGGTWDGPNVWRDGGKYLGRYPRDVPTAATAFPGGRLGLPPNLCARHVQ